MFSRMRNRLLHGRFGGLHAARYRLVAPEVLPRPVAAAWVNVHRVKVLVYLPDGVFPGVVVDHVSVPLVNDLFHDASVVLSQQADPPQVVLDPPQQVVPAGRRGWAVRDLRLYRARPGRVQAVAEVRRKADTEKRYLLLREMHPVPVREGAARDTEVD